ncbi:MAG: hypothetical protein GTN62_08120 [Gemmatimonadales bacterium]|nr:hypothetical protein [Gemmatimonadales bacterium]NIN11458.1 hypothetical protein [Gemmatimonadales bacterium]NIN50067.1 hypothetical protein [Gemmatimonadales bacterium]NIP07531.1 hypothetical protein [Gemmatimonadales bacterium]NIR03173.1 hypothetical protein [Gemmatimonadales bacterium]
MAGRRRLLPPAGGDPGGRGVALPSAVVALVVIGALVGAGLFIAMQEQRLGRNTISLQQAQGAAEEGAALQVADWNAGAHSQLGIGDTSSFEGRLADGTGWYRGEVRRLSDWLFLVQSEGFSRGSRARRRMGLLVRLHPLDIPVSAALTVLDSAQISGSSYVDGGDGQPTGWRCLTSRPPLAGIRLVGDGDVGTQGCKLASCVAGEPGILRDEAGRESIGALLGRAQLDGLRLAANKLIGPGHWMIGPRLAGGACDASDASNWGDPDDPDGPCGGYFPLVYASGDITLHGGRGQGLLVVDGDLSVRGGFRFYGAVVVAGRFKTHGEGGHFSGGVVAATVVLGQNTLVGGPAIQYSSCALGRALRGSAAEVRVLERGWLMLH